MQVLTDAQWAKFEAAIAAVKLRGARPRKDDRRTIEAIIWRLDNGAKWRSIPAELGNWHHAYLRFRRWAMRGVWDRIMAHVVAEGEPQLAFACIDGTVARAHQKAAGARPSKPTAWVCDSIARPVMIRRLWGVRGAVSAARSSAFVMPPGGSSTLSWCQARPMSLPPRCCC
jgi:transposase